MTQANYTAEVKGSLLLELPVEAEELRLKPGAKVQVQLAYEGEEASRAKPTEEADDWTQTFNSGHLRAGVTLSDEQTRREAIYDN